MFSHGVMTALFFAIVGVVYDRTHTRDIGVLNGLGKRMGFTATLFAIAGLASLGLPGLSGFVAELLVFLGLFQTYPILGVLGIVGAAITAVYILRLLARVFMGPLGEQWDGQTDASRLERVSTLVLAGFILLVGLYSRSRSYESSRAACSRFWQRFPEVSMNNDFLLLLPEFMVTGLAFVILTLDFFLRAERKHWLGIVGAVGLVVTLAVTLLTQWDTEGVSLRRPGLDRRILAVLQSDLPGYGGSGHALVSRVRPPQPGPSRRVLRDHRIYHRWA